MMDDNIGYVSEARRHSQLDNTISVFTTDNGAQTITTLMAAPHPSRAVRSSRPAGHARALRHPLAGYQKKPGTVWNDSPAAHVRNRGCLKGDGLETQAT